MASRSRLRTRHGRRRWLIAVTVMVVCAAGLVFLLASRYFDLPDSLLSVLSSVRRSDQNLPRGIIYDRNYQELAVSYERVSVYANVREIEGVGAVVNPLTSILEVSEEDLRKRFEGATLRLWLAKDITQEQEAAIKALALPGIFFHREYVRYYPNQASAAHLIGFVEEDIGLSGIEYYLNNLQTQYRTGNQQVQKEAKLAESQPGTDGQHLILTLDLKIQKLLEDYLRSHAPELSGSRYGVMVLEASSGAILGYAQKPSFDPNHFQIFSQDHFVDLFNQAMALPEELKIYFRDLSLLESQYSDGGTNLPWPVIAENRQLGVQLQLWQKLGISKRPRYDFVSEPPAPSSRVARNESGAMHRNYETVPVLLTPLQLVTALARSFYDGSTITPHVADRYVLRKNQGEFLLGDLEEAMTGNNLQPGVSAEAVQLFTAQAQEGPLESLISGGSSVSYTVVNKQKIFTKHRLKLALLPVQNPEFIFLGIISDTGCTVAQQNSWRFEQRFAELFAPVAARYRVIKQVLDMLKPAERQDRNFRGHPELSANRSPIDTRGSSSQPLLINRMPDLTGLSLRKSLRVVQGAGVTVTVKGSGRVVGQEPKPGTMLVSGGSVVIELQPDPVELSPEQ